MTLEEYLHLTQDLVNEDGELDRPKFQKLVLRRLKLYIQRQAADAVKYHESQPDIGALLSSTKYLLACEVLFVRAQLATSSQLKEAVKVMQSSKMM